MVIAQAGEAPAEQKQECVLSTAFARERSAWTFCGRYAPRKTHDQLSAREQRMIIAEASEALAMTK